MVMEEEVGDIIQVMPISLANKIAAGEVVGRPASVVKELVENALDAGADEIEIYLLEAGSTLIQVTDNGCGMSLRDAKLCFTRHATSKIRSAEDLDNIHTLGFRGEALASIAAVSHVELITGQGASQPSFSLRLEGGEVVEEGREAPRRGTSIAVRNLFYNVPARRNFLKRPQTELKHTLDMVEVLALSHPGVGFKVQHEKNVLVDVLLDETMQKESDGRKLLRERVIALTATPAKTKFIEVDESTSYLSVKGLLGYPDQAKRTKGQQYLFVNGRFVKQRYIEHAVHSAYEYLLPDGSYPFFVLFLDIDTRHVDVNVHPTKSEVKFDDERGVYGMLRAVVRRALGLALQTPDNAQATPLRGIDLGFDRLGTTNQILSESNRPAIDEFRPSFSSEPRAQWGHDAGHELLKGAVTVASQHTEMKAGRAGGIGEEGLLWQLHDTYILTQIRSGLVIIDQQAAHERILYEQAASCLQEGFGLSQQLLFPRKLELSAADHVLLEALIPDLNRLGFDLDLVGSQSVTIKGVPADIATGDEGAVLDEIIDQYRLFERVEQLNGRENLARSMAKRGAVKAGNKLSPKEMRALIDQLFECQLPYAGPDGRPTMITVSGEELRERFDKR